MSDKNAKNGNQSILATVTASINKVRREALKGELTKDVKALLEAQKVVDQITATIVTKIEDAGEDTSNIDQILSEI